VAGKIGNPLKAALRREVLAARDALPLAQRVAASARITQRLLALDAYRNAGCVMAYMSFGSEFDSAQVVLDVLASGKRLCLPRLNRDKRELNIHLADKLENLESGLWGIREPRADSARAEFSDIDFMLVPGVAFTARCERLGYGGGYYDHLIAQFVNRPPLVAAAFALQMRDEIPLAVDDQQIDVVVTEEALYSNGDG
jgi:5-formyltetrahydrofolate cyclo-ligase